MGMILQSEAIVLNSVRYSDSQSIVNLYSEQKGRLAVLVRISKKKGRGKMSALFQPLTIIKADLSISNKREIQTIKDFDTIFVPYHILGDIKKTAIATFLTELLSKLLYDEQAYQSKYIYLQQSIQLLDYSTEKITNFHIIFLLQFTKFLGIWPDQNDPFLLNLGDKYQMVDILLNTSIRDNHMIQFTDSERSFILQEILKYYQLHFTELKGLKSLQVLHDVFS
ncbi:MAG: DNA repair protein RecO [Bacteroidales bacterium]|nr:DNA repair protein RecO [Bacteroidales bacterium]